MSAPAQNTIDPRMIRARVAILTSRGKEFFAVLALNLKLEESAAIPTMATDGKRLLYSRAFLDTLTPREIQGVICHEIYHCALLHFDRLQGKNPRLANIAMDYAINPLVKLAGFTLPACALDDPKFHGMGSEEIYHRLLKEQEEKKRKQKASGGEGGKPGEESEGGDNAPGNDPGGCGAILPAAGAFNEAERAEIKAQWQESVKHAANVVRAQNAGKLPAYLEKIIGELDKPKIDWRDTLRRFADQANPFDSSWKRPNRRYLSRGLVLPGYAPVRPSHIVCVFDTSGSIYGDPKQVKEIASELSALIDEGAAEKITIAFADTEIKGTQEFMAGDAMNLKIKGGGGTDFAQPMAWLADNMPDASAIVFFTDGYTSSWGEAPDVPVLWILTGHASGAEKIAATVPHGETVLLTP